MGEQSLIPKKPWEKDEKEQSADFHEKGVGEWHATQGEARSGAVLDPMVGQDAVIRTFVVVPQKNSRYGIMEEILRSTLPLIKKNVIKDGWTFAREPSIRKRGKGYVITTLLTPAIKHGMKIGATNANPRSASDLLREANDKNRRR